mgnify:CR=1 FL=1
MDQLTEKQIEEIKRFLESNWEMSQSEDWSEPRAQELVMWGGELYEEFFKQK